MQQTSSFISKMILFVIIVTLPVAIVAFWLVSQNLLPPKYAVLLILTPIGPAVLIYNRLLREVSILTRQMGRSVVDPLYEADPKLANRSGLLPVHDFLLTLQQYRQVLIHSMADAESREKDANLLFDMLPNAVLVLDQDRHIHQFNQAAIQFFNQSDITGDLTSYLRNPALIKAVDAALEGQEKMQRVEFDMVRDVGRHIAVYVVALVGAGSQNLRAMLTLHDLTVARKTEQMRVDFIANASHELRTPLAILIGAIETLLGPAANDPDAQARFLSMMQAQSNRMSRLIDDLLSLSQIEMNEHSKPSGKINICHLLHTVTDLLKTKANDLGKTLELEMSDEPLFIVGDKGQLSQVFTNLVDNALKYGWEQSPVVIRLSEVGQMAHISIIDQSDGIAPEHLPRLTERFYRVDSARSREMGGTGLGLAIVKHIVGRHRGRLEIASTVGKGSVFTIKLPAYPDDV